MDSSIGGEEAFWPPTGEKRQLPGDAIQPGYDSKRLCTQHPSYLPQYEAQVSSNLTPFRDTLPLQEGLTEESYAPIIGFPSLLPPINDSLSIQPGPFLPFLEPSLQSASPNQYLGNLAPTQAVWREPALQLSGTVGDDSELITRNLDSSFDELSSDHLYRVSDGIVEPGAQFDGQSCLQSAPDVANWAFWNIPQGTKIDLVSEKRPWGSHALLQDDIASGQSLPHVVKSVVLDENASSTLSPQNSQGLAGVEDKVKLEPEYARSSSASRQLVTDDIDTRCDACFGMITATAKSSSTNVQDVMVVPVNVEACGNFLKLYFQDSNKYAGLLTLPALCKLLKDFTISLKAILALSKSRSDHGSSRQKAKPSRDCTIRIVVYGIEEEKSAVGDILSAADLFLQHPSAAECARYSKYCNPHYLLRPGCGMPKMEDSSLNGDAHSSTQPKELDEVSMARLLRVFDSIEVDVAENSSNFDPSTRLRAKLMGHQVTALAMMVERECGVVELPRFPTLWTPVPDRESQIKYRHIITGALSSQQVPLRGGIIADEMGLGKTLSILALICSSLDEFVTQNIKFQDANLHGTLIVSPKSTITGWQSQISRHIYSDKIKYAVYHGSNRERLVAQLQQFDIVLTTYETLRSDWEAKKALFARKWFRVVLDEAHHIRNRSSKVFKAVSEVQAQYRWCLTGTPIHNSLDDYGALLAFLNIDSLSEKSMFDFWIASPINEKKPGSVKRLRDLVKATCIRRTKKSATVFLDLEQPLLKVEGVELDRHDQELYDFFKIKTASIAAKIHQGKGENCKSRNTGEENILALMNFLRLICNHGKELLPLTALAVFTGQDSAKLDLHMMQASQQPCRTCGEDFENTNVRHLGSASSEGNCHQSVCAACAQTREEDPGKDRRDPPKRPTMETGTSRSQASKLTTNTIRPSAKVRALVRNLITEQVKVDEGRPIKSVIFSYWTKMLDLIEPALQSHGFRFQRIDGQTSLRARDEALRRFQEDPECTIMLASIGSCGEGIDLTAVNHVHLLEPNWNPMAEAQAIDRAHRKGQTRRVAVTRYIVCNSIETYIQWVQEDKLKLINQSINNTDVYEPQNILDERWKMLQLCLENT